MFTSPAPAHSQINKGQRRGLNSHRTAVGGRGRVLQGEGRGPGGVWAILATRGKSQTTRRWERGDEIAACS